MWAHRMTWAALAALYGCDGKSLAPLDPTVFGAGGETEDTARSTDSGDSGATVGSEDGPGTSLAVQVIGDVPNLGLDFHSVVLGPDPEAPRELADGVFVGDTATVDVALADYRWVLELDSSTRGFAALPFVYIDDNGDGEHTAEEQYVGLGTEGALYIHGEPGPDFAAAGFVAGWNAMSADLSSGEVVPFSGGLSGLSLEPQLIPQDRFLLEASFSGAPAELRVALVPETVLDGVVTGPLIFDQPVSSTVQVPIEGPPPDNHLQDFGADGTQYRDWRYGVEVLVLYRDTDASGGFSLTDTVEGMGCVDGVLAKLQHSTEPDKAFEALYLATFDIIPAWSVWLDLPGGARYERLDEVGPIVLSDACVP